MVYDALDMTYRTIKIRKDPATPKITELIDYEAFCGVVSDDAAEAAADSTITPRELRDMLDSGKPGRADRRPRAGRVGHQPHRRRRADPEVGDRVGRGAGEAAARPHPGALLQDRGALGRGAGRRPRRPDSPMRCTCRAESWRGRKQLEPDMVMY